ncbi:MAG: DNA mismatch repair endonuclease MutL [Thermodesulfobacteriota bacterium]
MSAIRILPEQLANQIAAGEVVERPASVVKELLENALDAGASQVTVQVEGNGTRLIRVIDDGRGMDHDDVLLSLERHATSKLTSAEQLHAITSLGFRGEAIPSIASVSRLTITSRQAESPLGTVAEVRHGTVVRVHEAGGAPGTTMEVRDLFGNVPARRKFLKSTATELSHIEETVKNYGLVRPEVGVNYTVDDRTVLQWPAGVDTLEGRTLRLLDRRAGQGALLAVEGKGGADGLAITGYLLAPEEAPATGARLRIFVNGRVVKDRMIAHAVAEGLHNFLLVGRSPAGVLLLSIAPETVDVNVHPTKQEVRFRNGQAVHQAVASAVLESVVRFQEARKESLFGRATPPRPAPSPPPRPSVSVTQVREPQPLFQSKPPARMVREEQEDVVCSLTPRFTQPHASEPMAEAVEAPVQPATSSPLRLLGQVAECYLLCESEGGLLVVDQHAAHERLLFEELRQRYNAGNVARQQLLFPKVLECTLQERQILEENGPELQRLGLEVEPFGGDSFVVKAVPAIMGTTPPEEVVAAILTQLGEEGRGSQRVEAVLASMACKAAVKAGQRLTPQEMEHLLRQMQEADIFSHCPHGRPVARRFTPDDLKKWFHRT